MKDAKMLYAIDAMKDRGDDFCGITKIGNGVSSKEEPQSKTNQTYMKM